MIASNENHITAPLAEVIADVRHGKLSDPDDLIARLLEAKSRAERAATAVHLAEKFVHLVRTAPLDAGVAVVGHDLTRAICAAKGIPSVLVHYQQMAREAEKVAA